VGTVAAAFFYDFLAKPRIQERPIATAVTHPDPDPIVEAQAAVPAGAAR
jgi:hypothetical protein